jgi:hypothetical protein
MSWLNLFFRNKKKSRLGAGAAASLAASGVQPAGKRSGAERAPAPSSAHVAAQRLEQRRTERNTKRDLLFQAVRESMVRAGVLSSAFKFKVLSLDQRGRSFLVLIDLAAEFGGEADKLAEIESLITQTARRRYELTVQAVYWRFFESSVATKSMPAPLPASAPTPLPASAPAPLFGVEAAASAPSTPARAAERPPAKSPIADQAKSKLLLTGYEDTELTDEDAMPALSGTQYGELR